MPEDGYNGWRNYETWSVALIIDNDRGLYNLRRDLIEQWATQAREEGPTYDWETPEQYTLREVAQNVRNWVEGEAPESEAFAQNGFQYLWSQLLAAALSEVDWNELAEHWVAEVEGVA